MPFDARPLSDDVDTHAVNAFARQLKAGRGTSGSTVIAWIIGGFAATIALTFFGPLLVMGLSQAPLPVALLVACAILAGVVLVTVLIDSGIRRARERRYRLSRFAAANNMTYHDRVQNPRLPGMIFSLGHSRISTDLIRGHSPRFVEFGNYQYTVKNGKHSTTYRWGYVAVKLDVPLPNIVLDATGNNSVLGSNLPASFRKDQQLSLEGDFDKYFTLYCPAGYERDALYLFTPDIMARFIDNAAQLDVEIVDDWLLLYTRRAVSTLDPATWAWLFGTVGALLTKFDQWARWRDDRLLLAQREPASSPSHSALPFAAPAGMLTPPPGVAQEGRRLKRGGRWVWLAIVIAFGALTIWFQSMP